MGVVDLAHDTEGNRVAVKRLTFHGSASEVVRARQRLRREADILARLHHPNIVRLLDVVEDGDDIILVMPYLSGGSLAERVTQHGPAPPADVEPLAQRLVAALAAAHQSGIIHRDIKPANVLYDANGEPMLADFGVAHTWDQTHGLTVAGMVVGTPGYMPPEQARDEPLTPSSDVFSLGATLLFAATGMGPYGSGDPGLLMVRAAADQVERIPKHLPKAMRRWLAPMLDPKPERRPTAVSLLAHRGTSGRHGWRRERSGSRRGLAVVAAVAAAVALVAGLLWWGQSSQSSDGPPFGGLSTTATPNTSEGEDGDATGTGAAPGGEEPGGGTQPPDNPGAPPVLVDRVAGDFTQPGQVVTVEIPVQLGGGSQPPGPSDACVGPLAVRLEVSTGIVADLTLRAAQSEPLGREVSRPNAPAVVRLDGRLCPAPGEPLQAVIRLLVPAATTPGAVDDIDYARHRQAAPAPRVQEGADESGGSERLGSYVLTREDG